MQSRLDEKIYNETLQILNDLGQIDHLKRQLSAECIDDRMSRIDVTRSGLETVDAVHCVLDRNRSLAFLRAIEEAVRPGDVVVEAGLGTGILAVMAAAVGGEVYGIEINKDTLALAAQISDHFIREGLVEEKNLNLIHSDASRWTPPRELDLIISENIYAGMFYEMQIQIVNHLLASLKASGRVIPESMCSYLVLSQTDVPDNKRHGQSFSPSEAEGRLFRTEELSRPVLYDKINFYCRNDLQCSADLIIPLSRPGFINSLIIYSPVHVSRNIILNREDMIFMGEDLFIVIDPPLPVRFGSSVRMKIRYRRGGKPEDGNYSIDYII